MGPGRKEYTRADSDNWRTLREEQEEDDGESGNNWRLSGPRRDGMNNASAFYFCATSAIDGLFKKGPQLDLAGYHGIEGISYLVLSADG